MYEVFDGTAARVLLGLNSGDSIRNVSQRIGTPYETVRQAVNRLEAAGFVEYDEGLYLTDEEVRDRALSLLTASARTSSPTIEEAYTLPHFTDLQFAFTRIDAVYVWTQGGYQVGRDPDDYPLFLTVQQADTDAWRDFFSQFNIPVANERQPAESNESALQIVLEPRDWLDTDTVEGYPVIPRSETIEYMQDNYATFASALEMLDQMYEDLSLDVNYSEHDHATP
ncbi:helix-turn-helix domain-containing protein [Haloarcula sp. K1]|uniref:MarR family transcriptional regulator n=1 Tax=Haloarcula sp. K1 TaxID=1622207 RepID=UPI0007BBBA8C|nr:helix-turn-helix domain-containing protein [Haloarcula sp. K1]KZX46351.1 RNA polymerase subunit sigma-70 [Haloarcula sp. K1]